MATFEQLRSVNPGFAKLSDAEIIHELSGDMGVDPSYVAGRLGYEMPKSDFGKDLSSGWSNYKAGLQHVGAALGSDTAAGWARENEAKSKLLESASGSVKSWENVNSLGDFGSYLAHGGAQTLPYVAEAIGAGLTGGGTELAMMAGRQGLRFAGESAIKRGAAELVERNAGMGLAQAERLAAEDITKGYARSAAAGVGSYPSSVGALLSRQQQENGQYDLGTAAAMGVPYAALNMVGLEGQMLRGMPRAASATALRRGGVGFAEGALPEAGAEMSQTFLERTGAGLKPFEGSGYEYVDSGILGGAMARWYPCSRSWAVDYGPAADRLAPAGLGPR
mgnify:FL=1